MTIQAAAIAQDGKVFSLSPPARHDTIIRWMVDDLKVPPPITGTQGFINHADVFLDRIAARQEAEACGQLKDRVTRSLRCLYSEDLW